MPTQTEYARVEIHRFLLSWKAICTSLEKSVYERIKEGGKTVVFGGKPKQPDISKPSQELLKRADELFDSTLENVSDIQDHYEEIIEPQLDKLPKATRSNVEKAMTKLNKAPKGKELADALHAIQNEEDEPAQSNLQTPLNDAAIGNARKALREARTQLRKQDEAQKEEESNKDNDEDVSGGLIRAGVKYAAGVVKGITKHVVTYPVVEEGIERLADGIISATNTWAHGTKADDKTGKKKPEQPPLIERSIRAMADYAGVGGLVDVLEKKDDEEGAGGVAKKRKADDSTSLFRLHADAEDAATFNTTVSGISVSDKELSEEKDLFISNNTGNITMKVLYEYICGIKEQNIEFYGEIIQKARAAGPAKEYGGVERSFFKRARQSRCRSPPFYHRRLDLVPHLAWYHSPLYETLCEQRA